MRNRDRFYEAFAHSAHRVMGRRLSRFTLKHLFWLKALGSPVVTGGEARLVDLERAAAICALPFEELDDRVPWLLEKGPSWWRRLGFMWRTLLGSTEREYADFQAYLLDHGCPPATHVDEEIEMGEDGDTAATDETDQSPLPDLMSLVAGLIRMTSWPRDEAWACSPGEAEWYLAGVAIHRGSDVKIKTPSDEAFEEQLAREKAAKEAEKKEADDTAAKGDG